MKLKCIRISQIGSSSLYFLTRRDNCFSCDDFVLISRLSKFRLDITLNIQHFKKLLRSSLRYFLTSFCEIEPHVHGSTLLGSFAQILLALQILLPVLKIASISFFSPIVL